MNKKKFATLLVGAALFMNGMYLQQAYGKDYISPEKKLLCETTYDLAYNTMIVRQMDIPKEDMVTQIKELVTMPQAITEALEIVDGAFEVKIVESESVETVAIGYGQFKEEECIKKNSGTAL